MKIGLSRSSTHAQPPPPFWGSVGSGAADKSCDLWDMKDYAARRAENRNRGVVLYTGWA